MTARRPEIYQPSITSPEYDPLGEEVDELENHRLPRVIVGALLSLAALATFVWFGYEHSITRSGGELVVIGPPPGPVRTKPQDPGGETQLYGGLKVYAPPLRVEDEAAASRLSPVSSEETELAAANPTSGSDLPPPPAAPKPEETLAATETPEYLQIGAYPTQGLAQKAFQQFRSAHADLAGELKADVKKADLGGKGVWYRLRLGPFAGKTAASASCDKMKKEGVTCLIAAR